MRGVRAGDSSRVSLGGISRGSDLSRWGGAAWGHPRKMPPEERGEARVEHCLGEPFRGQAGGRDIILWTGEGGGRRVKVRTRSALLTPRPGSTSETTSISSRPWAGHPGLSWPPPPDPGLRLLSLPDLSVLHCWVATVTTSQKATRLFSEGLSG